MAPPGMHFKGIHVGKVIETVEDLIAHSYPLLDTASPSKSSKASRGKAAPEPEAPPAEDSGPETAPEVVPAAEAAPEAPPAAAEPYVLEDSSDEKSESKSSKKSKSKS